MKLNSVKRSIRLILLILVIIALAFAFFFHEIIGAIDHNPIINTAIVSMQVFGVLYTLFVSLSLMRGVNSWNKFTATISSDSIEEANKYAFKGVLKSLNGRISDMLYSGQEIRTSILGKLRDTFAHRVSGADYLSGLLVGLGLLGTFIGLILTMGSIRATMAVVTSDSSDLSALLSGIAAPLGGMSAAFSASLLGLLGSLVMGLLAHLLSSIVDNLYFAVEDWAKIHADDPVTQGVTSSATQETTGGAMGVASTVLQSNTHGAAMLDALHKLLSHQKAHEANQIQQIDGMAKLASLLDKLIVQHDQSLELQSKTMLSQQALEHTQQSFIASIDNQQATLRNIHYELENANNALNAIDNHAVQMNETQSRTNEALDNVRHSTDQSRTALVEAIGGMNADRLQIVGSFNDVSDTLANLQSEVQGVRQQLLTIESVSRLKVSDSDAVVKVIRQQNDALLECVGQMTSIRASILTTTEA